MVGTRVWVNSVGCCEIEREGDGAPGGFGFGEPGFSTPASKLAGGPGLFAAEHGRAAIGVDERGFLRVDAELAEAAVGAVDEEAWRRVRRRAWWRGTSSGGAAIGHVVVEDEVEGVVDVGAVTVVTDEGGDAGGWAVEGEGLVDEVRAEIVEEAGGGAGDLLPGVGALEGAVAVEARDDLDDAAEGAFGEKFAEGEEVAVPAAVVEGREETLVNFGRGRRARARILRRR